MDSILQSLQRAARDLLTARMLTLALWPMVLSLLVWGALAWWFGAAWKTEIDTLLAGTTADPLHLAVHLGVGLDELHHAQEMLVARLELVGGVDLQPFVEERHPGQLAGFEDRAFAVLAAKRGLTHTALPDKSFYFLGGLTEATETLLFFVAMCVWPEHFAVLAYAFALMCAITIATRL
jgi:hypothetical protein